MRRRPRSSSPPPMPEMEKQALFSMSEPAVQSPPDTGSNCMSVFSAPAILRSRCSVRKRPDTAKRFRAVPPSRLTAAGRGVPISSKITSRRPTTPTGCIRAAPTMCLRRFFLTKTAKWPSIRKILAGLLKSEQLRTLSTRRRNTTHTFSHLCQNRNSKKGYTFNTPNAGTVYYPWHYRHQRRANTVQLDGHVQNVTENLAHKRCMTAPWYRVNLSDANSAWQECAEPHVLQ